MVKQFADYETSLKLKELGFDELCFGYFCSDNHYEFRSCKIGEERNWNRDDEFCKDVSSPLWQQVEDFLGEKFNIFIEVARGSSKNFQVSIFEVEETENHFEYNMIERFEFASNPSNANKEGMRRTIIRLHQQKQK